MFGLRPSQKSSRSYQLLVLDCSPQHLSFVAITLLYHCKSSRAGEFHRLEAEARAGYWESRATTNDQ